jgi:hypothetical protein
MSNTFGSPWSEDGPLRASQGSASHPAILIGKDKDSGKADAVLAPN